MKEDGRRQKPVGSRQTAGGRKSSSRLIARVVVFVFLLTASCTCLLPTAYGQLVPKGNSPLYSSRPYEPRAPSGLPKALNAVGIDQKLNEELPLDLEFRNEKGENVKLGS